MTNDQDRKLLQGPTVTATGSHTNVSHSGNTGHWLEYVGLFVLSLTMYSFFPPTLVSFFLFHLSSIALSSGSTLASLASHPRRPERSTLENHSTEYKQGRPKWDDR